MEKLQGEKSKRKSMWIFSLDDDALTEILVRLPVKCVIRFILVCKSWLSLISTDDFRRLHTLRRHKPVPSLVFAASYSQQQLIRRHTLYYTNPINEISNKLRKIPLDVNFINYFGILSISNGLTLLQSKHDFYFYVYNPATKQSRKLNISCVDVLSLHLLFDPSESPHYKIVSIRGNLIQNRVEVFHSESGTWRVCVEQLKRAELGKLVDPFLTCGELINLATCVKFKSLIYLFSGKIFCFDIAKNASQLIFCPRPQRAVSDSYILQESNSRLYYCALFLPCSVALWELQVNEDDPRRSKWSLQYDRRVHRLPRTSQNKVLRFIAVTSTELIHVPSGKVVAYNFLDESYRELLEFLPRSSFVSVHQFGETLAPL